MANGVEDSNVLRVFQDITKHQLRAKAFIQVDEIIESIRISRYETTYFVWPRTSKIMLKMNKNWKLFAVKSRKPWRKSKLKLK